MKTWAMEKGATHYTHWFQPLTGSTAEKHVSFLNPAGDEAGYVLGSADLPAAGVTVARLAKGA